ncbi:hypothetical protein GOP47_0014908 [Adiantum capillus-veneris]|uniref:AAA+ ATPase domain-containing protein n=1 Tax=Adiantum capillus-veneris TaxID=13818 RepID=A0A9D4UMM4_ADICA|nr:hypothetical protein GOP47_0014908 [Adiantum capillus-veneris]
MCCLHSSLLHANEAAFTYPQATRYAKVYNHVRRRVKCSRALAFSEQESIKESCDQARSVGVDDVDLSSENVVEGSFTQKDDFVPSVTPDTFQSREDGSSKSRNSVLTQTLAQESDKQPSLGPGDSPMLQADEEKLGKEVGSTSPTILSGLGPFCTWAWGVMKGNPLVEWINNWSVWQEKRRLEHLLRQADSNLLDASKQGALLAELNKHSPEAVIKRFEGRYHSTDAQCVAEYLRALVLTNAISDYLPDERYGRSSTLPALLQELTKRAGGLDEPFATPGMTDKRPLHVVMVDAKGSKSMRFIQELISTCLFMIFFSVMWVMFAAFLRKYVSSMGGMGPSTGISTSTAYAPKEYSKETLPEKNTKTFKDVKGCDEAKEELEEIVEYLKDPAKFTRLGGKLPKGVLLTGPPGTGKTLLAKAIAGEAGVPFFYRAGSEFEEMFVGVGARRVRALFQAAKKKAPCIVFIDEIDAVGSTRKQWEGHTKKTLHQLLVEMDGFEANEGIIVVAATNLPEILDPALTRPGRFDRHVVVTNPDVRGRQEILELYLHNKPLADDVDVKLLARGTPGFNGADLANLVNMAALKAAVEGTDNISGAQLEFAKDKIVMGTERKSFVQSDESRKLTAYHESGHAVVAFNTAGAYPIHKATITPRGNALGMVSQIPDKDETSVSKIQMLARLDVAMGGRVAEELIFGSEQVTTGARSDLQHATALARHMVSECGMSESVGPIYIAVDEQRPSQEIQRNIDAEVVRLLKEAYERVKLLLKKREADLHSLANALLEHETLSSKQIHQILSPFQQTNDPTPEAAS